MNTLKRNFIEACITRPKSKIASSSAEDFKIVSSNENTVVMTYIQGIKLEGKDLKNVSETTTYSKVKDSWKLIYGQSPNQ